MGETSRMNDDVRSAQNWLPINWACEIRHDDDIDRIRKRHRSACRRPHRITGANQPVYQWLSDKAGSPRDQDAPSPCLVLQALEPLLASTNLLTEPPLPPWTKPAPERVRTHTHSCMNLTSSAIQQNTEDDRGWACLKSVRNLRAPRKRDKSCGAPVP